MGIKGGTMKHNKFVLQIVAILAAVVVVIFVIGLLGLGWQKFFKPKYENVRREVFENTQSYVHGKIQDLAKYKVEYENAETSNREVIRQVIIVRFAEFDESKIQTTGLRNFLVQMRGY
jgi:cell division septal protein FtsQ